MTEVVATEGSAVADPSLSERLNETLIEVGRDIRQIKRDVVGVEARSDEVSILVKEAAENPLKVVFGGQELLFPLGEVVTVPAGVLSSLESMGQPVYRDLGLGVTEITAGVVFEVV